MPGRRLDADPWGTGGAGNVAGPSDRRGHRPPGPSTSAGSYRRTVNAVATSTIAIASSSSPTNTGLTFLPDLARSRAMAGTPIDRSAVTSITLRARDGGVEMRGRG